MWYLSFIFDMIYLTKHFNFKMICNKFYIIVYSLNLVWFPNSSARTRVRYSSICYPSNLRGIYARPDFLRMRVQIKMEPIEMKLKKCCVLCMKTEHKRLCRLTLNSDEEKFLQKHIGLFVVNGFICSNCKDSNAA